MGGVHCEDTDKIKVKQFGEAECDDLFMYLFAN